VVYCEQIPKRAFQKDDSVSQLKFPTEKTVPGPEQKPFIGNLSEMKGRDLIRFYYDMWQEYGDIVRLKLGPVEAYVLSYPDYIQHVLVKHPEIYTKGFTIEKLRLALGDGILASEGDKWKKQRRLMQPTYTPRGIQGFAEIMSDSTQKTIERWRQFPEEHRFDINVEMTRLAMSIISRSMFGIDVAEKAQEFGKNLHMLLDWVVAHSMSAFDVPLFIPTPGNQRLKHAQKLVKDFIFEVIEERRRTGHKEDLLSLLMTAKDEETGEVMSDEQLHDEILITFFAGHETTASLLTWTWYLLSLHPEVEDKLHAELDTVLAGRKVSLSDIPNLKYTKMVLDEALRLYSPAAITARAAEQDDEIDGYPIPKGALVTVFPYATHRHPDFWEHPLAFWPEHFTEERVAARPRYAYYPFGAGQRICIGLHFAQMEAVIGLAELAQAFKLRLASANAGQVRFKGVLKPIEDIMMSLEAR
jgi:cytochrome P450